MEERLEAWSRLFILVFLFLYRFSFFFAIYLYIKFFFLGKQWLADGNRYEGAFVDDKYNGTGITLQPHTTQHQ